MWDEETSLPDETEPIAILDDDEPSEMGGDAQEPGELARLRGGLEGFDEERLRMESMREQFEASYDPAEDDAEMFERQMQEFELRLKLLKDQSWGRQQKALDLEGKISTLLEDIQVLEGVLDERLGLR